MTGRVLRFLLAGGLTFLALTLVTFAIGRLVPVDPALARVGDRASAEAHARARAEMGLDRPLVVQYADYLGRLARGDLGMSSMTGRPVADDLAAFFPATVELASAAILLAIVFGVPAGIAAALHSGRWPDHALRGFGLLGTSVPVFWLGIVGLLVLYARLGWTEGPGRIDVFFDGTVPERTGLLLVDTLMAGDMDAFRSALGHLVLPAGVLGLHGFAQIARMTRALVLEQLGQDYVVAARAKGLGEGRVILRHVLANAAIPLVTVIALSYGALLEGAVLTETVFAWPGLGLYVTNALFAADMNAVLGGTILVGAVFVGLNLGSDLLYRALDPRAR